MSSEHLEGLPNPDMSVEFMLPRNERTVLLDGWSVPLIEGCEQDAGTFSLTLDGRFGLALPLEHAEQVVWFLAHTIATCWGYGAHPRDEDFPTDNETGLQARRDRFARVPHPSLQPKRMMQIGAVRGEDNDDV
jgi:hypothetical protein